MGRPQRDSNEGGLDAESTAPSTPEPEDQAAPTIASPEQSPAVVQPLDLDAETKALAKRYIDAGQIDRAMALLATLAPAKETQLVGNDKLDAAKEPSPRDAKPENVIPFGRRGAR